MSNAASLQQIRLSAMESAILSTSMTYLGDLTALVQHELQNPLENLQGVIRLLSTGRYGKLSQEGSQLLCTAMANLNRLNRLAIAVEEQPLSLGAVLSPEQIRILQLQHDLAKAVDQKELGLVYQPIINVENNTTLGFEALARWYHPVYGTVSPVVFIPLAEESGLIHQIGLQMIEQACWQLSGWQQSSNNLQSLTVSVNLSALQLSRVDFPDQIEKILCKTNVEPNSLKLEITESALIENSETVTLVLKKLRELGIQLYLDDFGTGYSALSRLPKLPLNVIKVDRTFVTNKNWNICEIVLSLAEKLGLNVIVEGIESEEEAEILKTIGFKYMQGFLFSYPLDAEAASLHLGISQPRDSDQSLVEMNELNLSIAA